MTKYASMQVCKYASMPVCQYARKQVYTCLYKKLNKKKDRARPYPRLRDFFLYNLNFLPWKTVE